MTAVSYPTELPELRPPRGELPPTLPLWLTQEEAEALILLCASSPLGAENETGVFLKLGELYRAFTR
jgi:hypothetical protein